MSEYATLQQLRDQGVDPDRVTDAQLLLKIQYASALIERWTGRWFVPKARTFVLDGPGHPLLQIGPPICSITEVRVLGQGSLYLSSNDEVVDGLNVRVYNRHLTQGLFDPDDRYNPKIEWLRGDYGRAIGVYQYGGWPRGVQNVQVSGWFGFTDPDEAMLPYIPPSAAPTIPPVPPLDPPAYPLGRTPALITQACMMLVARDLIALTDSDARNEQEMAGRMTNLRTRDQSISWGQRLSTTSGGTTAYSGDLAIDRIISMFARTPALGAV
jgi:hypothetical protein